MKLIEVAIGSDFVSFNGHAVGRPLYISRARWRTYWAMVAITGKLTGERIEQMKAFVSGASSEGRHPT